MVLYEMPPDYMYEGDICHLHFKSRIRVLSRSLEYCLYFLERINNKSIPCFHELTAHRIVYQSVHVVSPSSLAIQVEAF